jgi:hypothetical protein
MNNQDLREQLAGPSPSRRELLGLQLKQRNSSRHNEFSVPHRVKRDSAPLSFAQKRLWFLDQLESERAIYNICEAIRLHGSLQVTALERSFNEVVRRHESLRTTFVIEEGEPIQLITPTLTLPLFVVDLTDLAESTREAEAQRIINEEAGRPFDLSRGPLLRVHLIRLGEEEHVLVLHHIVSDGWSMNVLRRELSVLYQAFSNDQPSPLPEPSLQYADYAVWRREWLNGEVLESQLAYWKSQLEGAPPVSICHWIIRGRRYKTIGALAK